MTIKNYFQVIQCIIYLVSTLVSFGFLILMTMNVVEFQGKCLLFTTGVFNESDGRIFEPNWSGFSSCCLTLFNGFFFGIISLFQFYRMWRLVSKRLTGTMITTFWDSLIAFVTVLFTLVNSILTTVGLNKFCNSLKQNFESCEDAADSNVLIIANTDIKPGRFYFEMITVALGTWLSLVLWVSLFVFSSLTFYEYHEKENLIISMARERRRYAPVDED